MFWRTSARLRSKKKKVAEKKVAKKNVAKKNVAKKKLAATGNKTSPSEACVRNLGNSPRVPRGCVQADHVGRVLSSWRDERRSRPTHQRIMSLAAVHGRCSGGEECIQAKIPECKKPGCEQYGVLRVLVSNSGHCCCKGFWMRALSIAFGCRHVPGVRTPVGVPQ